MNMLTNRYKVTTQHMARKSFSRWGLPNQNSGQLTKSQRAQSINDKRLHRLSMATSAPMSPSVSHIPYSPSTLMSSAQRKREGTNKTRGIVIVGRDTPTNTPIINLVKDGKRLYVRCANGMIIKNPDKN